MGKPIWKVKIMEIYSIIFSAMHKNKKTYNIDSFWYIITLNSLCKKYNEIVKFKQIVNHIFFWKVNISAQVKRITAHNYANTSKNEINNVLQH